MIRVTTTLSRQNANTVWWFDTPAGSNYLAYRTSKYGSETSQPGSTLSSDNLTWVYSVTWTSESVRNVMLADPVVQSAKSAFDTYNSTNSITNNESVTNI